VEQVCIIHWQLARKVATLSPPTDEKRRLVGNSQTSMASYTVHIGRWTLSQQLPIPTRSYIGNGNVGSRSFIPFYFFPSCYLKNAGHTFFYYTSHHISRGFPSSSFLPLSLSLSFCSCSTKKKTLTARLATREMQSSDISHRQKRQVWRVRIEPIT
jgi:hypothetical protein